MNNCNKKDETVTLGKISEEFDCKIFGDPERVISTSSTIEFQNDEVLMWANSPSHLEKIYAGTVVTYEVLADSIPSEVGAILFKDRLRYNFARILQKYFSQPYQAVNRVSEHIGRDYEIGDNVFIGDNIIIGEGSIIEPNVAIFHNTTIGRDCHIQSGATIGTKGLGYERNDDGSWFEFPQIGGVLIEDNVEIGPNTTVRRAALGYTIIRRGAIIGGLVNIGHNSEIGMNSLIITGAVVGGSSMIGKNAYIGMNVSIRNKIKIGDGSTVGMGSVVVRDIAPGITVVGNPAGEKLKG